MGEQAQVLARLVREELSRQAPPAARRLAQAIADRVGAATGAVVFYGSCLRGRTDEGVFDFYVLVDDYASSSPTKVLARLGAWLPPNVFYIECPSQDAAREQTLRAKYAVISLDDFRRAASPDAIRTGIWARFCQPALAVLVRDEAVRDALVEICVEAILTAARRVAPLLEAPVTAEEFWQRVFAETYAAELRTESPEAVHSLVSAAPDRYEQVARAALQELADGGELSLRSDGDRLAVELPPAARKRERRRWAFRRRLAKAAYVGQLFKTAFTFGDWLPYALWKVERHTGVHIEPSELQRRHPLIFGWPLLIRVLRLRALR